MTSSTPRSIQHLSPCRFIADKLAWIGKEFRVASKSRLGRNAGWMMFGQGMNLVLQAGYFILLARLLGVREYGVFAGALAFVSIATPYSSLGSGLIFVRHVGADHSKFAVFWGHILLSSAVAGSIFTMALWLIAPHLLSPASASIVLPIGFAYCIFQQIMAGIGFVFQAYERLRITALLGLLGNAMRVLAVAYMTVALPGATARQWAIAMVFVSALPCLVGVFVVTRQFGFPEFYPRLLTLRALEGLNYSLGWSAQSAYNDIDKTLLSHYGLNIENGIYTMAYRMVDVATTPISALDAAALPRYVRDSSEDLQAAPRLAVHLAKRAFWVGICISVFLFFAAPLIPHIIGGGFTQASLALRWLCPLTAMRGIHYLTGSALTGMGLQHLRTASQLCVAAINLGLNLWLIPHYGWLAAAWVSLASDGSLALVNWILVHKMASSG